MKSISLSQKCFQALVFLALLATTAFAQLGDNRNPLPGGGSPKPSDGKEPDFEVVSIKFYDGNKEITTFTRETIVNATIKLKNKTGATKKDDHINLDFIPDMNAQAGDLSAAVISTRDIEFPKSGELDVHITFKSGYPVAKKDIKCQAIVNPDSKVAESDYKNNEEIVEVDVIPHKLEIEVTFTKVYIKNDMDIGEGEFRMKMRAGTKKTAEGAVTWLSETWYPCAPGAQVQDFAKVDQDKKDGAAYGLNNYIKLLNFNEDEYLVFETSALDDDSFYISVTNQEFTDDEDMGKCLGGFGQPKTWYEKLKKGAINIGPTMTSLSNNYAIEVNAKIINKDGVPY